MAPTATPKPVACEPDTLTKAVYSDRLTSIAVDLGPDADTVTFLFAAPSASRPQGPASLTLSGAEPPFYQGMSGNTVDIDGARHLLLRFSGMTIYDQSGVGTYTGSNDLNLNGAALNEIMLTDASEGIMSFVVGYDSGPCPKLAVSNAKITLTLPH